jgi:hypothetical protein
MHSSMVLQSIFLIYTSLQLSIPLRIYLLTNKSVLVTRNYSNLINPLNLYLEKSVKYMN